MTQEEKEKIINELAWVYSGQTITIRAFCEMVFYILERYNDPNLYLRIFDALLHRDDSDGNGPRN